MDRNSYNNNNNHRGTGNHGRGRNGDGGGRGGGTGWGGPAQSGGQQRADRSGGQVAPGGGSYRPQQQQTGGQMVHGGGSYRPQQQQQNGGQGVGPARAKSVGGGGGGVWSGRPGLHTQSQSQALLPRGSYRPQQQQNGGQGAGPTRGQEIEVNGSGGHGSGRGGGGVWSGRPGLHTQATTQSQPRALPGFHTQATTQSEPRALPGDSQFLEDDSTKIFARKVADHYSARKNQILEEQEASPIIHLKKLNNWIKSVLIQLYAHCGDAVLDLASGKGGDLIKWDKANIGYYVGIDIAEDSIEDCRTCYNGDAEHHQRHKKFTFPVRLLCGDCFEIRLDNVLEEDAPFDICSCQFAMHYSWSTEARARRALANVSALLRPGGIFIGTMPDANVIIKKLREAEGLVFGNSVYWIRFDEEFSDKKFKSSSPFGIKYKFHLEDAVDCPEWIVPFHIFKSLAEEYDLELVLEKLA